MIKPVDLLMSEQGISLPKDDFIQSVREFYSRDGQLMAMPFNLSAPVLYYNADILAKVGYGKHNFPQTWSAMEIMAEKIKKRVMTVLIPRLILDGCYLNLFLLSMACP